MTTGTAGTTARRDPRNLSNTMRGVINFNTVTVAPLLAAPGGPLAAGTVGVLVGILPAGAWITNVMVYVSTVFNGGTNQILLGSNATTYNNMISATDNGAGKLDPTVIGNYLITRGFGLAVASAADTPIYVLYTQSGGAATTGAASVLVEFEGGWST